MWNKLFFGLLAVATSVSAFFSYYSWSWLESIGNPSAAAAGYLYHADLAWLALWCSAVILLMAANAVLWSSGKSWAVWLTLVFFSIFAIVRFGWLDQEFFRFRKQNGMFDGSFSLGPLLAIILILAAGVVAFVDQLIVVRLRRRTYPEPAAAPDNDIAPADAAADLPPGEKTDAADA